MYVYTHTHHTHTHTHTAATTHHLAPPPHHLSLRPRSYCLLLRLLLELSRFRTVTTRTNLAQEFIEPYTVPSAPFRIYRTVYPLVSFCS